MPRMYTAPPPPEKPAYGFEPVTPPAAQNPNIEEQHVASYPPPAPPPPPPTPFPKTVRIDGAKNGRDAGDPWDNESSSTVRGGGGGGSGINDRVTTPTQKKEKPGIGKLPAEVMAELHGELFHVH
ncbi:unnamed protein product [Cylicostephanus goldi]|uniref:Uncharacterized protein n=1 Tax=Cylicostephanus goldi TaxID=71465 RepID=A0A3P6RUZ4_CYLGO|nr:unnamed protein product [Cylicostephanus goldi]